LRPEENPGDPGHPLRQPVGRPVGQPVARPAGQAVDPPIGLPVGRPVGQPIGQPVGQPVALPVGHPAGQPVSQRLQGAPILSFWQNRCPLHFRTNELAPTHFFIIPEVQKIQPIGR
jgi:hypothetical protein